MKINLIYLILPFIIYSCATTVEKTAKKIEPTKEQITNIASSDSFKLYYSFAGLGSNLGRNLEPVFKVTGAKYVYTMEQNGSWSGEFNEQPVFVCDGYLRASSIDSITNLVKNIKDKHIYEANTDVMSGGIHSISIKTNKIDITFQLHNATHPIAEKIVKILNSNIPADKEKLWLSKRKGNLKRL